MMRVPAAFSTAVRPILTGPVQPAEWLGASPSALYLITRSGTVLAILTHDAVRLPFALVLPRTAAESPLTDLVPAVSRPPASVGGGRIEWANAGGAVSVRGVREWVPARVLAGRAGPVAVDAPVAASDGHDIGVERDRVAALAQAAGAEDERRAVLALLGRGPGLTPSGDDVVAGFLLGARAFGSAVPGAVEAVGDHAATATTALSAQLLRHAVRGECVPEFAAAVAALTGRPAPSDALDRLLAVGHTSGAALAAGLLAAALRSAPLAVGGVR